jgi:uncharacterized protein
MLFAIICNDKPNSLELRLAQRPSHLEYLNSLGSKIKAAGPFLDNDGNPCGSLLIVDTETLDLARDIAALDPYAKAELFNDVTVKPWKWVINNPE